MDLFTIKEMFEKAFFHTFDLKKFLFMFLALIAATFCYLFCQAIGIYAHFWFKMPFLYIPLFLATGILLYAGIVILQAYEQELKGDEPNYAQILAHSNKFILKALYASLILCGAFFALWILFGGFILIKSIPYVGILLGIILSFAPFLLQLCLVFLLICSLFLLFFSAPSFAATGSFAWKSWLKFFMQHPFWNLLLLGIAFLPIWIIWKIAFISLKEAFFYYSNGDSSLEIVLQAFFMAFPFSAFMAPAVNFFFNFAYEAHELMDKH